jgi:hypothetical protein
MARQDYAGPVRWVIVDDGPVPQPVTFAREGWTLQVIRPEPYWQPGQNTQARNLAAGLAVIGDERVVVIEDDDYYSPTWLSRVSGWLDKADMVGECMARYFNIATNSGKQLHNRAHASLCSTAVKGPGLAALREAVATKDRFIDMTMWRGFDGSKLLKDSRLTVGIKGMPGRGGIGCGHDRNFGNRMNLRDWIGEDAGLYGR